MYQEQITFTLLPPCSIHSCLPRNRTSGVISEWTHRNTRPYQYWCYNIVTTWVRRRGREMCVSFCIYRQKVANPAYLLYIYIYMRGKGIWCQSWLWQEGLCAESRLLMIILDAWNKKTTPSALCIESISASNTSRYVFVDICILVVMRNVMTIICFGFRVCMCVSVCVVFSLPFSGLYS